MSQPTDYRMLRERLCEYVSSSSRQNVDMREVIEIFDEIVKDVESFKEKIFDYIPHEFLVSECHPEFHPSEYKLV